MVTIRQNQPIGDFTLNMVEHLEKIMAFGEYYFSKFNI